jgi:hypothetical protein
MTTRWQVPPDLFAGKTVAILGSGPSMTKEIADAVQHLPRICARYGCTFALDADMVVAVDDYPNIGNPIPGTDGPDTGFWPYALENFPGLKITASESENLPPEVMFFWHRWELVTVSTVPSHIVEFRNNYMSAIHVAEQGGAKKILLLGLDPELYDSKYGIFLTAGIKQLTAELQAKSIEVERIQTLEDAQKYAPPLPGESRPTATDDSGSL